MLNQSNYRTTEALTVAETRFFIRTLTLFYFNRSKIVGTTFEDNVDFSNFSIFSFKRNHVFIEKKHDSSERVVRLRLVFVDEEYGNLEAVIAQGSFIFQME